MAINSKIDICNLALGHLGNYGSIADIDNPALDKEVIFALWYDITRENLLKAMMPNFALSRRLVSELVTEIAFGYEHAFEYPSDCLKVLGLGNVDQRAEYKYSIEGNKVYTDDEWSDGMQLRFIKNITDVGMMSAEFKMALSLQLAANVCLPITQDVNKKKALEAQAVLKNMEASSLNAQENRPIRISKSKFMASRYNSTLSTDSEKK